MAYGNSLIAIETRIVGGSRGEDRVLVERSGGRTVVVNADGAGGVGGGATRPGCL